MNLPDFVGLAVKNFRPVSRPRKSAGKSDFFYFWEEIGQKLRRKYSSRKSTRSDGKNQNLFLGTSFTGDGWNELTTSIDGYYTPLRVSNMIMGKNSEAEEN